jgi:hypothetical protein
MDDAPITAEIRQRPRVAPDLWQAAKLSFVLQAIAFVFSSMFLDGGLLAIVSVVAAIAYWIWFVILLIRRGRNPTTIDLAFAKLGFAAAWPVVLFAGGILQRL